MIIDRYCILCGVEIEQAMGFVIMRDFGTYMEGLLKAGDIRELCGMDMLRITYHAVDGKVVERPMEDIVSNFEYLMAYEERCFERQRVLDLVS